MSENTDFRKMNTAYDLDNFSEVVEMEIRLEKAEKKMVEENC